VTINYGNYIFIIVT